MKMQTLQKHRSWRVIFALSAIAVITACGAKNSGFQISSLQSLAPVSADSFAQLTSHTDRVNALAETERLAREILNKRNNSASHSERLEILRQWQNTLEQGFILRHIYAKKIVAEMQIALFQNNRDAIAMLAKQLMEVGNGDFSQELATIADTLANSPTRAAVEIAIASFAHGNEFAARIFSQFAQNPTIESLQALALSDLPAPWIFSNYIKSKGDTSSGILNTVDTLGAKLNALGNLEAKTDPAKMATLLQARKKAYEQLRETLAIGVKKLLPDHPEAMNIARPLLTPPKAQQDTLGLSYTLHGITVREGDVVAWRFYPAAYSWEAFSDSTGRYSHVGIVSFSANGEPLIYDQDVASVNPIPFADALHRGSFVSIFRDTTLTAESREHLNAAVKDSRPLTFMPFDFHFALNNSSRYYCSEFVLAMRSAANLPPPLDTAFPRTEKTGKFFEQLGVFDRHFMAPGAFLLDARFTHVGTFYQDGAGDLVAANAMIDAMLEAFEKASFVDFSKSEGGTNPALSMQFARLLNIGGMRDMAPNFAKNFRAMDHSVMLGQELIEQELLTKKIGLENLEAYRNAAKDAAQRVAARIYKRAFTR